MKRILFCTPTPLIKSLGAAKVVVELAEEMQELGWECDLISIKDLADQSGQSMSESLRHYLQEHADEYNVVDYDHEYLPYARSEFSPRPLLVARSVLLVHHLETIPIPTGRGFRSTLGTLVKGRARKIARQERVQRAQKTVAEADLVNVSNHEDKTELIRRGIAPDKIVVIPYGISRTRRPLFDEVSSTPPKSPIIAFVGTFDYRKGAREFPYIVQNIVNAISSVSFRLLGTRGMYKTEKAVLNQFPRHLAGKIDVRPHFGPEELPHLLASCSVGIFPSYVEGFGFGILEMLASSVPVIAYDAPGPPMMLPAEYLVPRGDSDALTQRVIELLRNDIILSSSRVWAKQKSQQFTWECSAKMTQASYDCVMEAHL